MSPHQSVPHLQLAPRWKVREEITTSHKGWRQLEPASSLRLSGPGMHFPHWEFILATSPAPTPSSTATAAPLRLEFLKH